jgi:hypothetical protein
MHEGGTQKEKEQNNWLPRERFVRLMRMFREQVRDYPQKTLDEIFLHLDMIEKRYVLAESTSDDLSRS